MKRIGIIGVGLLGSAVASRLLKGGFEVAAYDTRPEQVKALQAQGLIAAASIAEAAAEADAVFTILPSLESVETTILGTGGLIETAPRDCTCDSDEHDLSRADAPSRQCRRGEGAWVSRRAYERDQCDGRARRLRDLCRR